jgi:hypothetical protein
MVTTVRLEARAALVALLTAFAGVNVAFAQTSLTLEDAIKRAKG